MATNRNATVNQKFDRFCHFLATFQFDHLRTGRHQARGQALYGSLTFGAGGMLGGLLSGWSWDAVGAGLTFTLSAAFALAGMIILWRGWPFGRQ